MPNVKDRVRDMMERLPDDCTIEDVLYHLYVLEKIDRGIKSLETRPAIPHKTVMKEMREWLMSSAGPKKPART